MPLRRTQETEPTVVTNDPKKWWLRKLQHDGANLKTLNEIVELSAMESRSRFKEEVIRALEAKRDGFVFFGESFTGPDDPRNRMWVLELACKYHKQALQEAIETIKGL